MSAASCSLLPCPFCGGEAVLIEMPDVKYNATDWDVGCKTKGCFLEHGADWRLEKEQAIELWNKRDFLSENVSVHQIRPTQRTFTTSTTFPLPVNKLPTSAVGFGWHGLFCLSDEHDSDCESLVEDELECRSIL